MSEKPVQVSESWDGRNRSYRRALPRTERRSVPELDAEERRLVREQDAPRASEAEFRDLVERRRRLGVGTTRAKAREIFALEGKRFD